MECHHWIGFKQLFLFLFLSIAYCLNHNLYENILILKNKTQITKNEDKKNEKWKKKLLYKSLLEKQEYLIMMWFYLILTTNKKKKKPKNVVTISNFDKIKKQETK